MSDGVPTLEVGFAIDTGASFEQLVQLQSAMDTAEAKVVADAARIEQATSGMVNVREAVASITSFGNAATRELQSAARAASRVEKSGEAMVRQLERQNAAFGLTREELRRLKAEEQALAAERVGNADLAQRIRASESALFEKELAAARRARAEAEAAAEEKQRAADAAARAAEQEAAALARQTAAAQQLAREQAELASLVRASQAAQEADAAAAERLRMATDPLYAATRRLNDEIAESTRLYHAGATAPAEYARQQQVLAERLREVERAHEAASGSIRRMGASARLSRGDMLNLGYQINDIVVSLASGQKPFMVFAQQGAQIGQIAASSGVGLRGMAASIGALLAPLAPFIVGLAAAAAAFALFDRAVSKGVDTKAMIDGLGLTRAEIKRLKDTSVDTGDVVKATFQVLAERLGINLGDIKKFFSDAMDYMTVVGRQTLALLYAQFVGTFRAIGVIVKGVFSGKSIGDILADVGDAYKGSFKEADNAMIQFDKDVTKRIASNKLAELKKQADEIKKDRTPKTDRHAEQLEREARATEAQIRNLYDLADAYGVSGAAALIAEARVKAESAAIKKRADIDEAVARQVRLAIAQRVSDAAKSTGAMREQADMQERVNAEVAAGNVPAALAGELLRDRLADLPLLDALEAARITRDKRGAEEAEKALEEQRAARIRLTDAERAAQLQEAMANGADRLAEMEEELRLVGATTQARLEALAVLRATQEMTRLGKSGPEAAAYIEQQRKIAATQYEVGVATNQLTKDLELTAQRADEVADAMSRAFGRVGSAIGQAISILGHYGEEQDKIDKLVADRQLTQAQGAKRSADLQMNSLIGLTSAAKGLFKEHSAGFRAMAAAEKALTIIQLARTAVDVAGGAARMFATLGPFAFPAVAAMLGVMAALGFSGGSGAGKPPEGNTGTGTVFGDSEAKSESIKRAIDSLKEVDTLTNTYAREMAASLRSIDSQIGNVAALVVRAGDINASGGVKEGFNSNAGTVLSLLGGGVGYLLTKIPIIGGILKSLFGTKTTVLASGLYGDAQSLGSILNGGFDASYYSDVQKKKKFFGLTYSTKYRTEYANADPTLENQFTLILKSFNDAILAAAGPLGAATTDIQNRLNSFVVSIGKIDLKDLTGEEIQEKLTAVFGAAADQMAAAAFPGLEKFQKVGEGAFETLVRVASTVEQVTNSLDMLGGAAAHLGIDAKMGLADQFESVSDFASAAQAYFERFYTKEEQVAARTAQLTRVFTALGLTMPASLDGFRALVDAQNLTTESGRATYAMLLQLAPAFADLQSSMSGAKSAADILSERQDLERKLLELQGDTAAIRALDLAKLDVSNRALQEQIYALQDAQEAAKAADELRKAWTDIGTSIMDEVKRIRGLADPTGDGSFASLMGQFNAATAAARAGDQDAAKSLPGLSQALLKVAADMATSRQELERIQAQTAASLEQTFAAISGLMSPSTPATAANALLAAMSASQAASAPAAANDDVASAVASLREEVAGMRRDVNAGQAAIAGNTGKIARTLDDVTRGGDSIAVSDAA